jgi:hypothetical protein
MKRPPTHLTFFLIVFISLCLVSNAPAHGEVIATGSYSHEDGSPELKNTILTAERDVLSFNVKPNINSTGNLTLVVHHEAWIINYYPDPKTITVISSVPSGDNHTIFGNKSLMQQSTIPDLFYPKNTQVLEKPRIIEKGNETQYSWNDITVDPNTAAIIAYSHDYLDGLKIYQGDHINLPGVSISREFGERDSSYIMDYALKNTGSVPLHVANLNLFFPEKVNRIQLIDQAEMIVDSPCGKDIAEKTSYNDGTGYFSNGHLLLSNCPEPLKSGEQQDYTITIRGQKQNSGTIFPSVITYYRVDEDPYNTTGNMKRIWPGVNLVTHNRVNSSQYYYYEVSVLIPETKFFIVSPRGNDTKAYNPLPRTAPQSASLPIIISYTAMLFALIIKAMYIRTGRL